MHIQYPAVSLRRRKQRGKYVRVNSGEEGTNFYVCTGCGKPCDIGGAMTNPNEMKLLPCPFCGGKAKIDMCMLVEKVYCTNPQCFLHLLCATEQAWNRRHAEALMPLDSAKVKAFFCNELKIDITTYAAEKFCERFSKHKRDELDVEALLDFIVPWLEGPYPVSEDSTDANGKTYRDFSKAICTRFRAGEVNEKMKVALEELFSACQNLLPFKGSTKIYDSVENANTLYSAMEYAEQAIASSNEKKKVTGETSDGYHTFNELYDHRCLLWINFCLNNPDKCYLVENHFEGWFLLGKETSQGQISYHCPNKFLNLCSTIERRHPEFDGHTSKDVIKRLERLAEYEKRKG